MQRITERKQPMILIMGAKPRREFLNRFNGSHANKYVQSSCCFPKPTV